MTQDLIVTTEGAVGRLRLNRPQAIHALNRRSFPVPQFDPPQAT